MLRPLTLRAVTSFAVPAKSLKAIEGFTIIRLRCSSLNSKGKDKDLLYKILKISELKTLTLSTATYNKKRELLLPIIHYDKTIKTQMLRYSVLFPV